MDWEWVNCMGCQNPRYDTNLGEMEFKANYSTSQLEREGAPGLIQAEFPSRLKSIMNLPEDDSQRSALQLRNYLASD
jgi:hypothetical protein